MATTQNYGTGRRKSPRPRVPAQGSGNITVNGRPLDELAARFARMIVRGRSS